MEDHMAIEYVCKRCGSTNVTSDAIAEWNAKQQRWIVVGHYDSSECHDCGVETDLIARKLADV
jgi:hypothetical protein